MVIGIIGKTQGVRFSASPPTKMMRSVSGRPLAAKVDASLSPAAGAGFFGAFASVVKLAGFCVAPPAAAATIEKSASTVFGGRHTLSLHDWYRSDALILSAFTFAVNGI